MREEGSVPEDTKGLLFAYNMEYYNQISVEHLWLCRNSA
jgi:hypothetical protein